MRASRGLKWENKIYKLKRSIYFFCLKLSKKLVNIWNLVPSAASSKTVITISPCQGGWKIITK